MSEFICNKEKIREILDYHQLKCPCTDAYNRISDHLNSISDLFEYNLFMKDISDMFPKGLNEWAIRVDTPEGWNNLRFYHAFQQRMIRYKLDADWKDLNSKLPKMTRAKRTRLERKAKVEKINKNNEES
jgi:hypothetical protein